MLGCVRKPIHLGPFIFDPILQENDPNPAVYYKNEMKSATHFP